MCGIAGLYSPAGMRVSLADARASVERMTGAMVHRGPDADGVWSDPEGRCVLGHRRLSIIETSDAGAQPMVAAGDGRHVITFNGELYNYLEIRPTLEALGRRFHGRTDTEVLLQGMAEWGVDALPRLDGMFAFAVFDTLSGELTLARDPFGEKPLYYTQLASGAIAFASELQALERCPGFDASVDMAAMAEVLSFQYIGAPRCIYTSVKKLPPGHWMRIDRAGRIRIGRYFAYKPGSTGYTRRSLSDLGDELEDILLRSISRRMIADVPLGAFLSGGVDSSTVCALIRRKLNRPLKTFSMGFLDAPESEHLIARAFAEHLGTEHYDEVLEPDVSGFLAEIGGRLDEPNADSSCLPTYLLSRFAREHVTVSISGDGGDEMFGGYGRYFSTLEDLAKRRTGEIGDWWTAGGVYYGNRILVSMEAQIEELMGFVPQAYADHLAQLRAQIEASGDALLGEMRRTDADNYMPGAVLPKVDRMSMQCSLEVRTPFLSVEVARFAERLPDEMLVDGSRGKLVLREIAYRYLPRELVDLPKKGFGLPMSDWARASLLDTAGRLLNSDDSRMRAALGSAGIASFLQRQNTPGQFSPYQVWAAAMLESWLRKHPVVLTSPEARAEGRRSPAADGTRSVDPAPSRAPSLAAPTLAKENTGARPSVYALGGRAFVVTARDRAPERMSSEDLLEALPRALIVPALGLLTEGEHASQGAGEFICEFPTLQGLAAAARDPAVKRLRGGTLLFADAQAGLDFGYSECETLQQLGVTRALVASPDQADAAIDLRLDGRRGISRAVATLRLFARRAAVLSNKRASRILGAKHFAPADDLMVSGEIRAIDAFPDVELSHRFSVFEGMRQLPPVAASHAAIRLHGNGRYSAWNQQLYFAPTQRAKAKQTYWIVRNDPKTERLLPIVARNPRSASGEAIDFGLIDRLARAQVRSDPSLQPGDSVVVCTHALPPGGAERQWVYLAQSLKDLGYKVTFVTYEPLVGRDAHYVPLLQRAGVPLLDCEQLSLGDQRKNWPADSLVSVAELRSLPAPRQLLSLAGAFRSIRPKAVFLQLDHPNVVGGIAAHLAGVPHIVQSFRNYNPSHFPYLTNDWFQPTYRALSRSPRVLMSGNHRGANDDYADWIGVPRERVAYIPNGIDPAEFPTPSQDELGDLRRTLGLDETTPVILGVFRLSDEKDPQTFLTVCARALSAVPHARAFIAGMGPLADALERRIQDMGLAGRVSLLGRRSDVNALMSIASVFLLTSVKEGMPNVILEAQLMGLPVVSTRCGATPQIVVEGETALLHEIGDADGLASDVIALLRDPARAGAMGGAGHDHVLRAFPKARLGQRYAALIRDGIIDPTAATPTLEQHRVQMRPAESVT